MAIRREGLAALLGLLLVVLPSSLMAQTSSSSNVTLTATVVVPLSITPAGGGDGAGNLDFGLVVDNTSASINPKTAANASLFTVSGSPNVNLTVTYTAPTVTLSDTSGSPSLTFTPNVVGANSSGLQGSAGKVTSGSSATLNGSGKYYFWLGGIVNVPSGQAPGSYRGTFNLTVSY